MKIRKAALLAAITMLLCSLALPGCGDIVRGSGNVKTEDYDFTGFSRIQISGVFEYTITRSDSYSLSITADDNLFEYIEVSREGDKLVVKLKPLSIRGSVTLEASIAVPELEYLSASGATRGSVDGFSSSNELEVQVSGASTLEIADLSAGHARLNVSGASRITGAVEFVDTRLDVSGASLVELEGSGNDIDARVSGASKLGLAKFTAANVNIHIDGASNGTINTGGALDARVDGASRLEYLGNPVLGEINISGASTFTRR